MATAPPVLAGVDEVEVEIEKLVEGGDGFARYEGITLFVPRSAPGDRLRIRLTERRPQYARGEIVEILAAGPDRREAPCEYFERCGGCDLQHIEDGRQVEFKVEAARETLVRLGGVKLPERQSVIAGDAWGYRLRTQLQVDPGLPAEGPDEEAAEGPSGEPEDGPGDPSVVVASERSERSEGSPAAELAAPPESGGPSGPAVAQLPPESGGEAAAHDDEAEIRVGYFARGSHELVPVNRCPVLVPELEKRLRGLPRRLDGATMHRLDLAAGDTGVTSAPPFGSLPGGETRIEVGGATYAFDARTFFQGHRGLLPKLVEAVVGEYGGDTADTADTAIDLFAGVGLFSVPLARRYSKVIAVEGDRIATRYARKNARLNKAENLEVIGTAVESWLAEIPEGADRIVVDPPRLGLTRLVRRALFAKKPKRLTYVSCHAAALARDLRALSSLYDVRELVYFDMFPQTGHLEIVAQLELADRATV